MPNKPPFCFPEEGQETGAKDAAGGLDLLAKRGGAASVSSASSAATSSASASSSSSSSSSSSAQRAKQKIKNAEEQKSKEVKKAKKAEESGDVPHYLGHRQRLRDRFMDNPKGLQNYELLELVLTYALPRRDVKPLAKSLLREFGDLWSLVRAPAERLLSFGVTENVTIALRSIGELAERGLQEQIKERPVITHWEQLLNYCRAAMGAEREEQFRLLFLDNKNRLMADEVQHRGTINHTAAYPREVVRRALDLGAASIILVHNHPSGDPTPSAADIKLTKDIVAAAQPLGIRIHDHLIISRTEHASLKALGLF